MVLKTFEEIAEKIKSSGVVKKIVVVSADDAHTLEAVLKAKKDGLVEPIFIGDGAAVKATLKELGEDAEAYEVYDEPEFEKAAALGVKLIKEGKGNALMKGKLDTSQILRAVVDEQNGIGHFFEGIYMSHIAINWVPGYHKLLLTTDGGMNIHPNFDIKVSIVKNAVNALRALGYENPKVAVLANSEKVDPKVQESVDAGKLKEMNQSGEIGGCVIEGPVALDIAVNKACAEAKHFESEVAGDADIIVSPNLFTSNTLGKSITELMGGKMAGMIVGADVPIVLTSRSSSSEEKYNSIITACAISEN